MFLFSEELPAAFAPVDARYTFEPYHYGPCSFEIYRDLDHLVQGHLVRAAEIPGRSWKTYSLSARGSDAAAISESNLSPQAVVYLKSLRQFVDSVSFRRLLDLVYRRHPNYAARSVFQF